jgi:VanZ family protein
VRRTLQAFLPLALWAAAVFVVGGLEDIRPPTLPAGSDKVAHFVMYGVGGALAAWAGRVRGGRTGLISLLFVVALGALDELRQATLLVTREGDVWDWVADAAGAIFFYLLTVILLRRR